MSLTLNPNGSFPIALVSGGDENYFVYLDEKKPEALARAQAKLDSILYEQLDSRTIKQITLQLQKGATIGELYDQYLKEATPSPEHSMQKYSIPESEPEEKIEILPTNKPENVYVAGPNGSGKSYIIGKYAKSYHRLFPDRAIILFCRRANDPAYEGIPREEIVLDSTELSAKGKTMEDMTEQIKEISQSIQNFANTLCIFDDVDNLTDKKLKTAVHNLAADLESNGRKEQITVVYVSHIMLNSHQTKSILTEASKVYFFPQSSGTRAIGRFLKEYAGLENKQIKQILAINNSRWVMISQVAPRYIATEKAILLI